jgi:DNA-binding transcriptional regulator YbjK
MIACAINGKTRSSSKEERMRTSHDRTKIRQQRIMSYFIEAADKIIKQDGIKAVTIRKAADLAGYTSATLYGYFDNLTHLIFLATMNSLEEYNDAIPGWLAGCKNSVEKYLAISECFSEYSFSKPEIYELLFFTHRDEKMEEYTRQYYELYPERLVKQWPEPFSKIFNVNNIYSRSAIMLYDCVADGYMTKENADDFNDVALMVFKCILQDVRAGEQDKKAAIKRTMKYYRQMFWCYLKPEHRSLVGNVEGVI